MPMVRREFLTTGLGVAGALLLRALKVRAAGTVKIKAIAFDGFVIFDPRPVAALCEALFPGRGSELVNLWRTRQFEYTWLRTVSNHYADFEQVTDEALLFAAKALKLEVTPEKRAQLLRAHFELQPWPDIAAALAKLKEARLKLAFLSNFTPGMLDGCIKAAGLNGTFDEVLSTDLAKTYKPDRRAYQLGIEAFKLPKDAILFAAFAGWDAAGAKSFGYPTFWVDRLGLPIEELGVTPDATGKDLADLLAFLA
jgi:2-haloacid dehalogenase